ncbi:aspartate racemase [Aneurinibacillus soli]|uniref:Aspartate racemase n=1 Tax=Aneurinibacillus soli TaxID=1500254 RepID=A0A0U5BAD0_9BACL|nr:amino acid racemase [Aneurinibacillus soli]PYE61319.1 aspartate racemase [Aneurinibacillus soli]BAU27852.1 Aspartate racemase [Aneurinibacillus soli]
MKTIGIIGGMGSMATVDLFEKIVTHTPATADQQHIPILIYNNPSIPSRMDAILKGTKSPLFELVRSAQKLEKAGADFLIMPCNTAHYWLSDIQSQIRIPLYSMIEHAASYIEQFYSQLQGSILLLASKATIQKKLYQQAFFQKGLPLQLPEPEEQKVIDFAIQDVKASIIESNKWIPEMNKMLEKYDRIRGTSAVLGACTEIPLLFPYLYEPILKLDPTLMIAKHAITLAQEDAVLKKGENE